MTVPSTFTIFAACLCGAILRVDTNCRETASEIRRLFAANHTRPGCGDVIRPILVNEGARA